MKHAEYICEIFIKQIYSSDIFIEYLHVYLFKIENCYVRKKSTRARHNLKITCIFIIESSRIVKKNHKSKVQEKVMKSFVKIFTRFELEIYKRFSF